MLKGVSLIVGLALRDVAKMYDKLPRRPGQTSQFELGSSVEQATTAFLVILYFLVKKLLDTLDELLALRQAQFTAEDVALAWKEAHLIQDFLKDLATGKTLADAVVAHGITWDLMSPMLLTAIGTNVIPEVKKRAEALYPKVEVTPASLELPVPEPAPEPVEPMQRTDEQEPGPPSYSSIGTQTNPMPAITAEQVEAINFESEVTPPTSDTPAKPEAAETTPVTATVLENIAEPHEVVTTALQDGEPG